MALPEFKDEKEFRETWIGPFLSRMGYILPKHIHGQDEQGKDFFFADHDKFGHIRFHSAQAKVGDIGVGLELTKLLEQIERSFEVSLKYHKGAHDRNVSSVYVMTTGKISSQARERIWEECRRQKYGENIYTLDGDTLDNLNQNAMYIEDRNARPLLLGLARESDYNTEPILHLQHTTAAGKPIFQRCRTIVLEHLLRSPLPDDLLPYPLLSAQWALLSEINKNVVPINLTYDDLTSIDMLTTAAWQANLQVRDAANKAIAVLDERQAIELTVNKPQPQ